MIKIGMTSGAAIAMIAVAVLCYQPSHASDALLAKAQSEFTAKARDALLQRRNAQPSAAAVLAAAPRSESSQNLLASLGPKLLPSPASLAASENRSIPARTATAPEQTTTFPVQTATAPVQAATADVVEASVVAAKPPDFDSAVSSETEANEVKPELKPLPAGTTVQNIAAPKQPELPETAASQVVTPVTNSVAPATVKIQKSTRERVRTVSAKKASTIARRFERELPLPYDGQALRGRAPEIAAVIARYM
jgi:hypothetical protein